ncbi:response regulator [Ramlibacter sp. Leaf400]|uniref:response regulator n=1 Tax=Ramlibacter sp. Leaf400 TaxID=1736365 RepID=UPI0012E3CD58|nr:response regulator transcription factor [Ramlibacter sp. Leaf400]
MQTKETLRVFLAEDSAPIRERIAGLLDGGRLRVIGGAATPADCIAGILREQPDVVVLDSQLEGGSGLEVLRAVRRVEPAIAFVVFSNHAQPPYARRYLADGAASVLDKSLDFERLSQAVEAAPAAHRIH